MFIFELESESVLWKVHEPLTNFVYISSLTPPCVVLNMLFSRLLLPILPKLLSFITKSTESLVINTEVNNQVWILELLFKEFLAL